MSQLYDALRIVAAISAILLIAASPWVVLRSGQHWTMRARIIGSALVCVGLAAAYLATLGQPTAAPWRLTIIAAGVFTQAVGAGVYLWHLRRGVDVLQPPVRTVDMLSHLPVAVIVADKESRILTVAGNSAAVLGWTPSELRGRPLATIIPPRYVAKHLSGIERYNQTGDVTIAGKLLPLYALDKDRAERPVTLNVQPIAGSRFVGVIQPRDP